MPVVTLDVEECRREGELPAVCLVCGQPAQHYTRKNFRWAPGWTLLLILIHLLVWLIVSMMMTRRAIVMGPFCDEHLNYWRNRTWISGFAVFAGLGCIAGAITALAVLSGPGASDLPFFLFLAGAAGMLFFLIFAAIISKTGVTVTKITDFKITLKNVHEQFQEELIAQRKEQSRRVSDGEALYENDDE